MKRFGGVVIFACACARTVNQFEATSAPPPSVATAVVRDGASGDTDFQNDPSSIAGNWSGFSSSISISGYEHTVCSSAACDDTTPIVSESLGGVSEVSDPSLQLTDGKTYFNCVRAVDAEGQKSAWVSSNGDTLDTDAPSVPTQVGVFSGDGQVFLTWAAASDAAAGVGSYEVSYCQPSGNCALPATPQIRGVTGTFTTVVGLDNCQTFDFAVRAVDKAQNASAFSATVPATAPLTTPTNVVVVPGIAGAEMSWNPVLRATSYEVCYGPAPGACAFNAKNIGATNGAFLRGLALDTAYFSVRAMNAACPSPPSIEVNAPLDSLATDASVSDINGAVTQEEYGLFTSPLSPPYMNTFNDNFAFVGSPLFAGNGGAFYVQNVVNSLAASEVSYGGANTFMGSLLLDTGLYSPGAVTEDFFVFSAINAGGPAPYAIWPLERGASAIDTSGARAAVTSPRDDAAAIAARPVDGTNPGPESKIAVAFFSVSSGEATNVTLQSASGSASLLSSPSATLFGTNLLSLGDVDGDGISDLAVAGTGDATLDPLGFGYLSIYSGQSVLDAIAGGPAPAATQHVTAAALNAGNNFATSLAVIGDADGDGIPEWMVSGNDGTGFREDFLLHGGTTNVLATYDGSMGNEFSTLASPYATANLVPLERWEGSAGDADDDGYADYWIERAEPSTDGGGTFPESVFVYSGADNSLLYQINTPGTAPITGFFGGYTGGSTRSDFIAGFPYAAVNSKNSAGVVTLYRSNALSITPGEGLDVIGAQGFHPWQTPALYDFSQNPPAPTFFMTFTASGGDAPYHWQILTQNSGSGASIDENGNYTCGYTPNENVYDTIRVSDARGRSQDTRVAVGMPLQASAPPPPPFFEPRPLGLQASAVSETEIDLQWKDTSSDERDFLIEYKTPATAWATLTTVGANVTAVNVTTLSPNTLYAFRVKAQTAATDSLWSPVIHQATP